MNSLFKALGCGLNTLRAFLRDCDALVICLFAFFIVVFLTDNDLPNRPLDIIVYISLALGLLALPAANIRRVATSPVLVLCFLFILHHLLSPVWTGGGMPRDRWLETARLAALGLGSALLVGGVVSMRWKLLRWFPFLAACAALSVSAFSIGRFVVNAGWQAVDPRLVTFPWPNSNTGTAVLGLVLAGLAFIPVQQLIPGGGAQQRLPSSREPQNDPGRLLCLVLLLSAAALALLDIVLSSTRSVLVALSSVVLIFVVCPTHQKIQGWRIVLTAAIMSLILGVIVLFFVFGNQLIIFRSLGQRDEVWIGFWHIARETFWLGRGLQNEYQFTVSGVSAPHNQILTALLYGGIGSAVLYCALYARMLFVGIKYYARLGCFSLAAITTYVIVHGMFETVVIASYPGWRWLYFWAPIGLAAGLEVRLRSAT